MDSLTNYYLTQGVLGVTVVALILVVVWQQRRIDSKDKQITDLQDKRKSDTDSYTASYTAIIKENIGAQKDSNNAQVITQNALNSLVTAVQAFINK